MARPGDLRWVCKWATRRWEFADRYDNRFLESEIYRLKGELLLTQKDVRLREGYRGKTEEAEEYFRKSIEISQRQQAKTLELRAVMSLVRLRQNQAQGHAPRNTQHDSHARLDESHQMLSEVYKWFTEGFDTQDLKDAKVLLDELTER